MTDHGFHCRSVGTCFEIFAEVPIAQKPLENAIHFFHHYICNANVAMENPGIVVGVTMCYMKSNMK